MSPTVARAAYRRQLEAAGRTVTIRRTDGSVAEATVLSRVAGYAAAELGGGVIQGDRKVIALAEDFELAGWDRPKRGDQMTIDGRLVSVESVDADSRNPWGTALGAAVAYEIQVRG